MTDSKICMIAGCNRQAITPGGPCQCHVWIEATSPDGQTYYYHFVTRVTCWEKPDVTDDIEMNDVPLEEAEKVSNMSIVETKVIPKLDDIVEYKTLNGWEEGKITAVNGDQTFEILSNSGYQLKGWRLENVRVVKVAETPKVVNVKRKRYENIVAKIPENLKIAGPFWKGNLPFDLPYNPAMGVCAVAIPLEMYDSIEDIDGAASPTRGQLQDMLYKICGCPDPKDGTMCAHRAKMCPQHKKKNQKKLRNDVLDGKLVVRFKRCSMKRRRGHQNWKKKSQN